MIDTANEHLVEIFQAHREIPAIGGKRIHPNTPWRWHARGVAGVRLETVRIDGVLVTSTEALDRFFAAVTTARDAKMGHVAAIRTPAQFDRAAEKAGEQLAKMGA